jgi:hypothetical protein
MIRALTGILAAAICMMLAGCGAQGEAYQPRAIPASQSLIYIYRPYKFLSSQSVPMITCGHESIELDAGGFYEFRDDPGTITCAVAGDKTTEYKFDTHAGERYFVREEVESSGLTTSVRFTLKNAAVAEDEIQECSRQGIKQ